MSAQDYDLNWWHRIEAFNRGLKKPSISMLVNRAESGMMRSAESFYVRNEEPKPDPRNYKGAGWSEAIDAILTALQHDASTR